MTTVGRHRNEVLACGLFIAANLAVPLFVGDLYPFTNTPMFADSPKLFCNYTVYDPAGRSLPLWEFNLHRVYRGNPLGLGGISEQASLDRFGAVADQRTVIAHVAQRLRQRSDIEFVDVLQEVIGPVDKNRVGVMQANRWRVYR